MAGDSGLDGTYTLNLHCNNCGDLATYTIEKGTRVASIECDNCGLKSLRRESWINRNGKGFIKSGLETDDDDDLSL